MKNYRPEFFNFLRLELLLKQHRLPNVSEIES